MHRRLAKLEENRRIVKDYFAKHKPLLNIHYEYVFNSLSAEMHNAVSAEFACQINSFLQLEQGVNRTPSTIKLTPNDLLGAVENYNKLAEVIAGTNYEHILAEQ